MTGRAVWCMCLLLLVLIQGCAAVNTFPTAAKAGDTVSVMIGGSAQARKESTAVVLTDANGVQWDLQALGLVRSVFNVRADGRARGLLDASQVEALAPWAFGHEPLQTVMVTDLPAGLPAGVATLTANMNVADNSSGVGQTMSVRLEIIAGAGQVDSLNFLNVAAGQVAATNFARLEPAPHARLSFGTSGAEVIGAASLVVDFDETVLSPANIKVYIPELETRDASGTFGAGQRMTYWRTDGQKLYIDIVAPQGIPTLFLKIYVTHSAVAGNPAFALTSAALYDITGTTINLPVQMQYFP